MKKPSEEKYSDSRPDSLWNKLIGLGETSFRKNYFPELQERLDELERFRILLDHSSDFILLVHLPSRRIIDVNASSCRQLGYTEEELHSLAIDDVLDLENIQWPLESAEYPECGLLTAAIRRKDTGLIPVEMTFSMDSFAQEVYLIVVGRDITQRLKAERALLESKNRFRSIFDSAGAGMAVISPDGHLWQVNPALCRFLGYSAEELLALDLDGVTHPDDIAQTRELYLQAWDGTLSNFSYEKRYVRKDRAIVWGQVSVSCLYDLDQAPMYCIALVQDITERKKAEVVLRESDRIKGEFITVAAHELRTPLTSVQGFAQILLTQENLSARERREFLRYIYDKSVVLNHLVEDLLDIARIEAGQKMHLNRGDYLISWLIDHLAPMIHNNAKRRHIETFIEKKDLALWLDGPKLVQVLENLLSNAIKYSPEGSRILIRGRTVGPEYQFSVQDEGIGMTPEQVERIFDKFYRVDDKNTAVYGLGLGMSIVRNIVKAHGGRIWVESVLGEGTTVHFTLPLKDQKEGQ